MKYIINHDKWLTLFAILLIYTAMVAYRDSPTPPFFKHGPESVAPPRDPTPFSRPNPLATVNAPDVNTLASKLNGILLKYKFDKPIYDSQNHQILAQRKLNNTNNTEKIIIWFTRSFASEKSYDVYFIYAQFGRILGLGVAGDSRMAVSQSTEDSNVGGLKSEVSFIK